jgi:hypothetical protein
MAIPKVDTLPGAVRANASAQPQSQQKPRQSPSGDSINTTTSNECCLTKLWNVICNFFKWICPCLCGRSKQGTQQEVIKPNEGTKQCENNANALAAGGFILTYGKYMTDKDDYPIAVKAFNELQEPDVQWHVLYLMVQREDLQLGKIKTYVSFDKTLGKEVCDGLKINSLDDLVETNAMRPKLRQDLREFLQRKLSIQDSPPLSTQPPMQPLPLTQTPQQQAFFFIQKYQDKGNLLTKQYKSGEKNPPLKAFGKLYKDAQLAVLRELASRPKILMEYIVPYILVNPEIDQAVSAALKMNSSKALQESDRTRFIKDFLDKPNENKSFDRDKKAFQPETPPPTQTLSSSSKGSLAGVN